MSLFGSTVTDETWEVCADELRECNTLNEMFDVLNQHYNLDEKLGVLYKGIVLSSLPRLIKAAGIKKR